jgi:hypothetical protein
VREASRDPRTTRTRFQEPYDILTRFACEARKHKVSQTKTGQQDGPRLFKESPIMVFRIMAALPFIGILLGIPFVNQVEPLVLGMPFVLAWIVIWILLSAAIMGIIYRFDPANRQANQEVEEVRS